MAVRRTRRLLLLAALLPASFARADASFGKSWDFYLRRVREGAGREERRFMLEKLARAGAGDPGAAAAVERERRRLEDDRAAEFDEAWSFYRKRVAAGASPDERRFILRKLRRRFDGAGLELGPLSAEESALEAGPGGAAERLAAFRFEWDRFQADKAPAPGAREERLADIERRFRDVPESVPLVAFERDALRHAEPEPARFAPPEEEGEKFRKKSPFGLPLLQVDYWPAGDVFRRLGERAEAALPGFVAIGYDSASSSLKTGNAVGVRLGALWALPGGRFGLGGSVGYLTGPSGETVEEAVSDVAEDGRRHRIVETRFTRVLAQATARAGLGRRFELRASAGAGAAFGKIEERTGNAGSFVSALGYPASSTASRRWNGFAWEAGPSVVFCGSQVNAELGVGWAAFPRLSEGGSFDAFAWSPFYYFLKIGF